MNSRLIAIGATCMVWVLAAVSSCTTPAQEREMQQTVVASTAMAVRRETEIAQVAATATEKSVRATETAIAGMTATAVHAPTATAEAVLAATATAVHAPTATAEARLSATASARMALTATAQARFTATAAAQATGQAAALATAQARATAAVIATSNAKVNAEATASAEQKNEQTRLRNTYLQQLYVLDSEFHTHISNALNIWNNSLKYRPILNLVDIAPMGGEVLRAADRAESIRSLKTPERYNMIRDTYENQEKILRDSIGRLGTGLTQRQVGDRNIGEALISLTIASWERAEKLRLAPMIKTLDEKIDNLGESGNSRVDESAKFLGPPKIIGDATIYTTEGPGKDMASGEAYAYRINIKCPKVLLQFEQNDMSGTVLLKPFVADRGAVYTYRFDPPRIWTGKVSDIPWKHSDEIIVFQTHKNLINVTCQ